MARAFSEKSRRNVESLCARSGLSPARDVSDVAVDTGAGVGVDVRFDIVIGFTLSFGFVLSFQVAFSQLFVFILLYSFYIIALHMSTIFSLFLRSTQISVLRHFMYEFCRFFVHEIPPAVHSVYLPPLFRTQNSPEDRSYVRNRT